MGSFTYFLGATWIELVIEFSLVCRLAASTENNRTNSAIYTPIMKKTLVLSLGYWFGARSLGLLIHPYISMRRIMRDKVYSSLVYLPSVCLGLWWLIGLIIAQFNVLVSLHLAVVANWLDVLSFKPLLWSFIFIWVSVFLILWQFLLAYLLLRFNVLTKEKYE
jgi:hypothetical protein